MIKYETVWGAGFGVWDEPLEGLTPDSTGRVLSFSYSRALLHTAKVLRILNLFRISILTCPHVAATNSSVSSPQPQLKTAKQDP